MNKMIEVMKREFNNYVIMLEKGSFCNVYGNDAYIVSYLFNYRLKQVGNEVSCGFPKSSLNKIITMLEMKKINYMLVDRSHQYEEQNKVEFKENSYEKMFEIGCQYLSFERRVEGIKKFFLDHRTSEKVLTLVCKVEENINEARKASSC